MKKRTLIFLVMSVLLLSSLATVVCAEKDYDAARNALNEKIAQQRKMIKERQKQQWIWNTAKVVGPLGLMAFTAYQLFKPSPTVIDQQTQFVTDLLSYPASPSEPFLQNTQDEQVIPTPQEISPQHQPLIKEDVLKYKQASKAYGAATVYFSLAALFDPFYYPYVAANLMGSLYYGVKSLQLPLKPVVLKGITILPPDMPY